MDKILSNLGLCARARGLVDGTDIVCSLMANNRIYLVFLANDASENAKKKIRNKANYYNVEVQESYSSEELSSAIGKVGRMVVGISNESFLKILKK